MCSARASKIEEWFDPIKGKYRGYNIALGCGDYYGKGGIFAIDVDNKYQKKYGNEKWGHEAWKALLDEHGEMYGPIQRTPSGGIHVLAMWRTNLTPSQNKIGLGIDTRGGVDGKISSHIMAWPSVVDGIEYEWERGGDIADPPPWVVDAMGVAWTKQMTAAAGGRGNEMVGAEDTELLVPLPRAAELLATINPDDLTYDEWLRCGQAIHSQHSGKDGLDVWDEWSQKGERYVSGECSIRWDKFKENGPIRMGTLFYIAQNAGAASKMTVEDAGSEEGMLVDLIDEYNSRFALVLTGEQAKVIKKEPVPDSIQYQFNLYSIDAFKAFYSNDTVIVQDAKGNPKPVRKFDMWMASTRRRSFDGMLMHPAKDRVVELGDMQYLNTWAGFAVRSVPGDWSLLKEHIMNNLCSGIESHYEWLMDWMADMFQDPANPKGCAVVLGGIEGAGKGTLANAIVKIFGIHGSVISNGDHLTSRFNSMVMDSVFLFADEVIYAGNHEVANRLKAMVSEKTNTKERKFGDMKKADSFLHIMMATNNDWKVAAGPESRRWFVLETTSTVANDREYFGDISRQMNNGGYEAMLHELSTRQVIANLRYAPETAELRKQRTMMQVQSLNDSFPAWMAYIVDSGNLGVHDAEANMSDKGLDWPEKVDKIQLWEAYAEWSKKYKQRATVMSTTLFYPKMLALDFREGPRIRSGNSRIRTFLVPSYNSLCTLVEKVYAIQKPKDEDE
jgi:hypothetical protein